MRLLPWYVTNPDLIAGARAGSNEALSELFAAHADTLLAVAFRLTSSRDDAEDIVQDVFVGLPEALRTYEERGAFGGWLKRVTVRYALMRIRRTERRYESALEGSSSIAQQSSDHVARIALSNAIDSLSPSLKAVFVLHEIEGYSHIEIGDLLGIRAGTSEVRLFRARGALRALLED